MASAFEEVFDLAMDALLSVEALMAVSYYTAIAPTVAIPATVIFNEQVGAIDGFARAVFTLDRDDIASPKRGDFFVIDGETTQWVVVDVRDDRSGGIEIRCDSTLERQ